MGKHWLIVSLPWCLSFFVYLLYLDIYSPLQCFDAVGWAAGRASGLSGGCWHGYLSGARCRLVYSQRMPLPLTVSCFSKIQIGFTFLVPAHLGSTGKRAIKRVCVCMLYLENWFLFPASQFSDERSWQGGWLIEGESVCGWGGLRRVY